MVLAGLHTVSIAFGGLPLLDNVSFDIHKGQRICFLGRNGAGKSTLMKIIAGLIQPDAGEIVKAPGVRIAYLPQEIPEGESGTVFEVVARGAGPIGEKIADLHRLKECHDHSADSAKLHHYLAEHESWHIETAIERALEQVELDPAAAFGSLSGGMQRRVYVARTLAQEPDLLLLDEPTNHLDIKSISWLESFILGSGLTVLFVTHDRRLLKQLATWIVELDRGKLADWPCDYETFLTRKQALLDSEEKEWAQFDKKLAQEEAWIRRGIKARRTRNEGRVRALIRMREERKKRRERTGTVSMAVSEGLRSGERVLEAENVSFSYGPRPLIANLTTTVMRRDRIGVIGPNGCGKTTLLNILLGNIPPQQGMVTLGANLQIRYSDQLRQDLDTERSVWENVLPNHGDTVIINGAPRHIISYLSDFLFTSERAKSPVKQLSGGEQNRLMLARLFTLPANVLVLDEPTNDLDTETLELLEEIIMEFDGTVLVVSHDREFLNNVVTATLVFEGNGVVKEYTGGYDDWERLKLLRQPAVVKKPATKPQPAPDAENLRSPKKLSYKEKNELETLPACIEQLEKDLEALNLQMADPALYSKQGFVRTTKEHIATIEYTLMNAYTRWEELDKRHST